MKKFSVLHIISFFWLFLFSNLVFGSGFRVGLDSVSDLGNQFAGGAASVDDAGINYYNPAGITLIRNSQLVFSGTSLLSTVRFDGSVISPSFISPDAPHLAFLGNGAARARVFKFIPAFHFVHPVNSNVSFGLSLTVPFGLSLSYGKEDSFLRYVSTDAGATSFNLGPSLGYKITDRLSIGLGPDILYFNADLQNMFRTQPITTLDSNSTNRASGYGYGGHIGLLYEMNDATRLGLSYRTQVVEHLKGDSFFNFGPQNGFPFILFSTDKLEMDLTLPPVTMLSIYHRLNLKWSVMGTIDHTKWSTFGKINFKNVESPQGLLHFVAHENFRNTIHAAIATNYKFNDTYLFRLGIGVDQDASREQDKDIISPALGVLNINIGLRYQPNASYFYDVGYAHTFARSAHTSRIDPFKNSTIGKISGSSDVFGFQLGWNIGATSHP